MTQAVSRGVQIAFAAGGPKPAGPSRAGVVSACGHFGQKLLVPAVREANGWSQALSGGRARGGIVSGARSCICLLEVLAERALCSAAEGLEVSAVAEARVGDRVRGATHPLSGITGRKRGVPAEQHADRRPAP